MPIARLPFSPSRSQALVEFESILLRTFEASARHLDPEVRDVMHYALFSVTDRFCTTAAWMLAPAVGVAAERFSSAAYAIEILRCLFVFKTRPRSSERFLDPALSEAAAFGLQPLAFQTVLTDSRLHPEDKLKISSILSGPASPAHAFTALHHEARLSGKALSGKATLSQIQKIQEQKASPIFEATGAILEALSSRTIPNLALVDWFRRLGMFSYWISLGTGGSGIGQTGSTGSKKVTPSFQEITADPGFMDLIMTLEAGLLNQARDLGFKGLAHEIIGPLGETLKPRLQ